MDDASSRVSPGFALDELMGFFDQRDPHPSDDWELAGPVFKARYAGTCRISSDHPITKGTYVGVAIPEGQPMSPRKGTACAECTTFLRKRIAHGSL